MSAAMLAGDGDVGTFFAYSDLPQLEAAGVQIIPSFSGYNEGWYFNLHPEKGHPALKDLRVRQALAYAFDRQGLVNTLLWGHTGVAATLWDNTPWVDPSIVPFPYDPEKANALLDEAGWLDTNGDGIREKDGVKLVLSYGTTTRQIRKDVQEVAQQDLAQVGIWLDLKSFDSTTFFASYSDRGPSSNFSLDIIEYSDSPNIPDPYKASFLCSQIPSDGNPDGDNIDGICDPDLDNLFSEGEAQVDFVQRQMVYYKITNHIFYNVYWLGLWQDPDFFGFSRRMRNIRMSGFTPFFNVFEWDVSE
jgi:peptide/nickel transport system substrate-binding protein